MGKLINRIPGSRLLISSLPGSALRTLVESLGKPRDVNKALPGKLDIKRHSPSILFMRAKFQGFFELYTVFNIELAIKQFHFVIVKVG